MTMLGICSGLVVSALYSGSRCPGLSPGQVIVLCSWARHFTLTVPLSTQEYKWVPVNCQGHLTKCWGITCYGLTCHPVGVAILLVASCYRNRDKLQQQWATRLARLNLFMTMRRTVSSHFRKIGVVLVLVFVLS